MTTTWDDKLPAGLRFMVTKTTKGRLGLIIGQHKFRKSGAQKDGSLIFRCSLKDCPARVNLDAPMRRLLRIRSNHNHPGRDLSDIISTRLPAGVLPAKVQLAQEDKIGGKSGGSKRYSYLLCAIHCWQLCLSLTFLKFYIREKIRSINGVFCACYYHFQFVRCLLNQFSILFYLRWITVIVFFSVVIHPALTFFTLEFSSLV